MSAIFPLEMAQHSDLSNCQFKDKHSLAKHPSGNVTEVFRLGARVKRYLRIEICPRTRSSDQSPHYLFYRVILHIVWFVVFKLCWSWAARTTDGYE